jgi:hypothetical protein
MELPSEVAYVRQAEDRAHRQGTQAAVNVYFLCAKGTSDDRRWQHLNASLTNINQVGLGVDVGGERGGGGWGGQQCLQCRQAF